MGYDFEPERAISEARARGARRVLVQAPGGLKQYVRRLCERLEAEGVTAIISTNPCYGGCDLAEGEAKAVGADLIIHIGHHKFGEGQEEVPAIYIPAPHIADAGALSGKAAEFLKGKGIARVGLVANTQHQSWIGRFKDALQQAGIESIVDKPSGGLVLGCRTGAASRIEGEVDAVLFIGGGEFHALGVAMAIDKEVYIADPYRTEIRETSALKKKALARRWWAIMEATKAITFGIVVVAKTGQFDMEGAERIREALRAKGKGAFLISAVEVNWEGLAGLSFVDAFIVTGCPRIAVDNQESFGKPVLNVMEAQELLRRV